MHSRQRGVIGGALYIASVPIGVTVRFKEKADEKLFSLSVHRDFRECRRTARFPTSFQMSAAIVRPNIIICGTPGTPARSAFHR